MRNVTKLERDAHRQAAAIVAAGADTLKIAQAIMAAYRKGGRDMSTLADGSRLVLHVGG